MATFIQRVAADIRPDKQLHPDSDAGENAEIAEYRVSRYIDEADTTKNIMDFFAFFESEGGSGNPDLTEGEVVSEITNPDGFGGIGVSIRRTIELGSDTPNSVAFSTLYTAADHGSIPWSGNFYDLVDNAGIKARGWYRTARITNTRLNPLQFKKGRVRYDYVQD